MEMAGHCRLAEFHRFQTSYSQLGKYSTSLPCDLLLLIKEIGYFVGLARQKCRRDWIWSNRNSSCAKITTNSQELGGLREIANIHSSKCRLWCRIFDF